MLTNTEYGKQIREREAFNRAADRVILGKDNQGHHMNIKRKARPGIGQFADITKPMCAEDRVFIRERAKHVAKEAFQRVWIVGNPFAAIRKRIVGK
jgi:hypothetical protein